MNRTRLVLAITAIVIVVFGVGWLCIHDVRTRARKMDAVICAVVVGKRYTPPRPKVFGTHPEEFSIKLRECGGTFTFTMSTYREKFINTNHSDTLRW